MLRISIRKMMHVIAWLAFFFAVMIALSPLVFQSSRCGRDLDCASNLRNVTLAILGYESAKGVFPDGTWPNDELGPGDRLSWYAQILPYLDEQERFNALDMNQAWDADENDISAHTMLKVSTCPGQPLVTAGGPESASFVGIAGLGIDAPSYAKSDRRAGIFGYDRRTKLADIEDGTAQTMMVAETGQLTGSWLQGGPATVRGLDPAQKPYVGPGRQFGGLHGRRACVAMADGSVRWVNESVDPAVFEALSTMAGGDRLPADW